MNYLYLPLCFKLIESVSHIYDLNYIDFECNFIRMMIKLFNYQISYKGELIKKKCSLKTFNGKLKVRFK